MKRILADLVSLVFPNDDENKEPTKSEYIAVLVIILLSIIAGYFLL